MGKKELSKRYFVFLLALFVSALGVSVITRSYLGTSPISSIPYVLSINTPLTMGTYIFVLNMFLILGQMLMLGKKGIREKRIELLMQIPVSVLFGLFIDITMGLLSLYMPEFYAMKVISLIIGCAILACGICLEVVADVTMISGEFFVQIASKYFKKEFGIIKIIFDVSLVVIALAFSLLLGGSIVGLREGTIIAALLTGPFVRLFKPYFGFINKWQTEGVPANSEITSESINDDKPVVITISREYGSGGHLIGKQIAEDLGIKFYDRDLIKMVAQESGMSEKLISEKEQHISSSLLYQMIMQDYEAPIEKSLSTEDALFVAQSKVIRHIASKESCVIVGRCADYILDGFSPCINVFLHADMKHKIEKAISEYDIKREDASYEIDRINNARESHYYQFTGKHWGDMRNYDATFNTSIIDDKQVCEMIELMYKNKLQESLA